MKSKIAFAFLATVLWFAPQIALSANPKEASAPEPTQDVLIRAGWIFDGSELRAGGSILVRAGRIVSLLPDDAPLIAGAKVLDATTCTVMPGLIDSHTHFMGSPQWEVDLIDRTGWGKLAAEGLSRFPQHRMSLLKNGVTTIIEMGSPLAGYIDLRNQLEKRKIMGPEIYFPGPLFTAPNGHPAGTIYQGQHDLIINGTVQVDDPVEACRQVRKLVEAKVDFIKIVYDRMWYTPTGAPRLKIEVAKAIVEEAHQLGLKVFAHVGSQEEAFDMVAVGVDGIEHSFGSDDKLDGLWAAMVRRHVTFTPTLVAYTQYAPKAVPPMKVTVKRAVDAGVPLALGTDYPASGGLSCGDDVYAEMRLLEEAGVQRLDVLRASTSGGAAKLGKEEEIGTIAPGRRANLIFVDGRVDQGELSSTRIVRVMLHGAVVIENQKLMEPYSIGFGESHILTIPYFYWDPLTNVNLGVSFTDFDLFGSGISLSSDLVFSTRNMWAVNLGLALPSPIPKTSLAAGVHFDTMNRLFWGIGNSSSRVDPVEYQSIVFRESLDSYTTLLPRVKFYGTLSADQIWLGDYQNRSLPSMSGSGGERLLKVGMAAAYDSREHAMNPWNGILVLAGGEISPGFLGTAGTFGSATIDLRGYVSPFLRHVIAARVLYRQALGPVPFYYQPSYGGAMVGRGFYPGRFIDRVGLYGQLEYRIPIYKILSGAVWFDVGQVQPDLARINWEFHPAVGFGPRFSFGSNENSIMAVDVGFSPEGWTLYVRQGLAF